MQELITSLPTVAVNAGVFVGMVIVTILGWKFGKKKEATDIATASPMQITGALLQDNVTVMMTAEANRVLAERMGTNTHCMERNTDMLKEVHNELERLNRNIEWNRSHPHAPTPGL